ncbi:hypothetical protein FNV43_RR04222 [Rhamnella rubrinervis]|uniref:Uncharacterized protein n=1 Tax=Rhamnella rubrinervis TaxID=2594499 RepID=A0A8K0HJ63_9ROSA|nr:hypothetical protein FNV43_RR04222 [Rhamnella rubrinervis]
MMIKLSHYLAPWKSYGDLIDYVNFQFYAYDKGTSLTQLGLLDTQSSNYNGGKVLASFIADGSGGLSPKMVFHRQQTKESKKLNGLESEQTERVTLDSNCFYKEDNPYQSKKPTPHKSDTSTEPTKDKGSTVPSFTAMVRGSITEGNVGVPMDIQNKPVVLLPQFHPLIRMYPLGKEIFVSIRVNKIVRLQAWVKNFNSMMQKSTHAQIYRPKPLISAILTDSIRVPLFTVVDTGIVATDSEAVYLAQENTKGKGVQTISSNLGVVNCSDTVKTLNDIFDDLDDKLPLVGGGVL